MPAQTIAPDAVDKVPAAPVVDERDRDALETLEAVKRCADGLRLRLLVLDTVADELTADLRDPSPLQLLEHVDPLFYDDAPTTARRGLPLAELVAAVTNRAQTGLEGGFAVGPAVDGEPALDRVAEIADELERLDKSYRRRTTRLRESRAVMLGRLLTFDGWTAARIAEQLGMTEADLGQLFEDDGYVLPEQGEGGEDWYRVVDGADELQREWVANGGHPSGSTDPAVTGTAPGPSPDCRGNGRGHAPPDDPARRHSVRPLVVA